MFSEAFNKSTNSRLICLISTRNPCEKYKICLSLYTTAIVLHNLRILRNLEKRKKTVNLN